MADKTVDILILGATGYVAGELLRLLSHHPTFRVRAAISQSRAGTPLEDVFPHLRGAFEGMKFSTRDEGLEALESPGPLGVFSATPHGETASIVAQWVKRAESLDRELTWVDISADFRLKDLALYEDVYGRAHGAPELLERFTCAIPELTSDVASPFVSHPGCFTTAVSLACYPLHQSGLVEDEFFVSAVTGSTGSGREPKAGTHHPERHASMRAYSPLVHRHAHEMQDLIGRARGDSPPPNVLFVPHSGPFARGIHATVHARLRRVEDAEVLRKHYSDFYTETEFVSVGETPPVLKEVIGTNRARMGLVVRGRDVVVFSVIDNLTKGAAGGAIQWMNRLHSRPSDEGLRNPGLGWH